MLLQKLLKELLRRKSYSFVRAVIRMQTILVLPTACNISWENYAEFTVNIVTNKNKMCQSSLKKSNVWLITPLLRWYHISPSSNSIFIRSINPLIRVGEQSLTHSAQPTHIAAAPLSFDVQAIISNHYSHDVTAFVTMTNNFYVEYLGTLLRLLFGIHIF